MHRLDALGEETETEGEKKTRDEKENETEERCRDCEEEKGVPVYGQDGSLYFLSYK